MPHSTDRAIRYVAPLVETMHASLLTVLTRRVDVMVRHLQYLRNEEIDRYVLARDAGWSPDRLDAVVGLNSFYQLVLAPLASAARDHFPSGLVQDVPIAYGSRLRFDPQSTRATRWMMREFREAMGTLRIPFAALEANQVDEMLLVLMPDEFR